MRSLKYKIRQTLIDLTGYFIYRKSALPVGIDLSEDLQNKFGIVPKVIFDVGANIGQTAESFAEMFPNAEIFSFEPFEGAFRTLESRTSHLKRVKRFKLALGESNAQMEVKIHDEDFSYLNSLKAINENQAGSAPEEKIEVQTLCDFCQTHEIGIMDLLKIDTEGYELEVLRGGEDLLAAGRVRSILCEVALSKRNKRNSQLFDLHEYLERFGYFFVGLHDSNLNYYSEGSAYSNALFVLPESALNPPPTNGQNKNS